MNHAVESPTTSAAVRSGQGRSSVSGVGVLDKAAVLLDIVEQGPAPLAELVVLSGLPRPTVHRIAVALERVGLLDRDSAGRFVLGSRIGVSGGAVRRDRLAERSASALAELHGITDLDVRLFRRRGPAQICVGAVLGPLSGQDLLPLGAARPIQTGPVAQALLAWEQPEELYQRLRDTRFTAAQLALVRRRGWAYGPDMMLPDTVSIAVPVRAVHNRVVAVLALSGPHSRMSGTPARETVRAVVDAASRLCDEAGLSHRTGKD